MSKPFNSAASLKKPFKTPTVKVKVNQLVSSSAPHPPPRLPSPPVPVPTPHTRQPEPVVLSDDEDVEVVEDPEPLMSQMSLEWDMQAAEMSDVESRQCIISALCD